MAGGALLAIALMLPLEDPRFIFLIALAALCLVLGICFRYLRVRDEGDALSVWFGPLLIFGMQIPYKEMASVEIARTGLIFGIGVHGLPFWRITYNLAVGECVRVTFKRRRGWLRLKSIDIGTDDAEGLAAYLNERIAAQAAKGPRP